MIYCFTECAKKEINLLFLGETGVGKSTLINALANYLKFSTLSDAKAADGFFPVPASFTVIDPKTYRPRTFSTSMEANEEEQEDDDDKGESVTARPTAYVLKLDNIRITLIDTPGVRSTHGSSKDKENAYGILKFISAYERIDLICIVVKANETRLTENFVNCLLEILRNLHKSAEDNVVFCVTFSKTSYYGPGTTCSMLAQFCHRYKLNVKVDKNTVFCFENEAIHYLADSAAGDKHATLTTHDYIMMMEQSWCRSAETTQRLMQLAVEVQPHSVVETLSLNNARRAIVALCRPVVQTAKCVAVNVDELKRTRQKMAFSYWWTWLSNGKVEIIQICYGFVERQHSATVCTSSTCCTIDKGIVYERICHEHCSWTPTVRMCRVFDRGGSCEQCGCCYRQHRWSTCVLEVTTKRVEFNVREIERRTDQSMEEMATLVDTCAKLTVFLHDNWFSETFEDDVISDSIQKELDRLSESSSSPPSSTSSSSSSLTDKQTDVMCDGLRKFLTLYNDCLRSEMAGGHSPSDIHDMIEQLFRLPINGSELRQGVDIVQASADAAVKTRQKVFYIHSCLFS